MVGWEEPLWYNLFYVEWNFSWVNKSCGDSCAISIFLWCCTGSTDGSDVPTRSGSCRQRLLRSDDTESRILPQRHAADASATTALAESAASARAWTARWWYVLPVSVISSHYWCWAAVVAIVRQWFTALPQCTVSTNRVSTPPGKSWKFVLNFQVFDNVFGHGKSWKLRLMFLECPEIYLQLKLTSCWTATFTAMYCTRWPVGLALDLEDYRTSVLLHCWLGHLTCKIVSEMTYNMSSGTLNPTIPYTLTSIQLLNCHLHCHVHVEHCV